MTEEIPKIDVFYLNEDGKILRIMKLFGCLKEKIVNKNVILIVSSQEEFLLYDFGIRLTDFQVLKVYSVGEKLICEYPVDGIEQIEEVRSLDMHFEYLVYGGRIAGDEIHNLLKCIAPENKILTAAVFFSSFLDPVSKMKYIKEVNKLEHKELLNREDVVMGDYSYGNPEVWNHGKEKKLIIGKFCSIAPGVTMALHIEHRLDWNTTYPFNAFMPEFEYITGNPFSKGDIIIGNDVWIGINAFILSGITIGDGCVIGARAVVSHSVPPYCVVAGNPARIVKKRFSDKVTERFLEMCWWDWEEHHIYNAIPLLQSGNLDGLYEYYVTHIKNSMSFR